MPMHASHHCRRAPPERGQRIGVTCISQPCQDQPIGQLIDDQTAYERGIAPQSDLDALAPINEVRAFAIIYLTQESVEEVGVEVGAAHVSRVARSRPDSGNSSPVRPSTQSISSVVARPPDPAMAFHRSASPTAWTDPTKLPG